MSQSRAQTRVTIPVRAKVELDKDQERAVTTRHLHHPEAKPLDCRLTCQRKYAEDIMAHTAPWWKELFFRWVYFPFTRWCVFRLEIFPPSGKDKNGDVFWIEDQGVFLDKWKAEQDAAKYPYGLSTKLPFDSSLSANTVLTEQDFPNSPAREKYKRNTRHTIDVEEQDLRLLDEANKTSAAIIAQHKTAASQ